MQEKNKLKNTVRFPTSIIIRGQDLLGIEIAKSLLEQGGYVIIIDKGSSELETYLPLIDSYENLTLLDFDGLTTLHKELRRLDYVFYLNHQVADFSQKISTQEFLQASNYLDSVLDLTTKFDAKFLLTTSIKAHQMIVANRVFDLNFDPGTEEKYTVYSELEIQRYSESLVKEYQEKVGVNARVVRLGTLLGRGMEINLDSSLIKLILEAIQGKELLIPGDGLETDYYIHYLDAAYGIIKSQFSPNTKGKIYTLANEEEVSILSMAYKLMELVSTAKELRFNSEDNSLPPIKMYKPAENLITIGWKPRISLERALAQTVDYLKARLQEVGGVIKDLNKELIPIPPKIEIKKTFKQKLLDFFFIAEKQEQEAKAKAAASLNTEGALARLIAERKNQELARKGNIILANNNLRDTIQPKPHRNFLQRLDDGVNNIMISIRKRFELFKNMTLLDFIFFILGIAALAIVYLIFISPVLSFGRNLFFMNRDLGNMTSSLGSSDYPQAKSSCLSLKSNIEDAQQRIQDLEYLFVLTQKTSDYQNLQLLFSSFDQLANGYDNIITALEPFGEFSQSFSPNFISRIDDNTFLSVAAKGDAAELINEMYTDKSILSIGVDDVTKVSGDVKTEISRYPAWLSDKFLPALNILDQNNSKFEFFKTTYEYLPTLLGKDAPRKYMLLVQDNLRYTAGGGEFVGYLLFDVQNGKITNVKVRNMSDLANLNPNPDTTALAEIRLVSNAIIDKTNVTISDLSLIADRDVMLQNIQNFVETEENVKIDMSATINLKTLQELLNQSNGLEVQQVVIKGDNFWNSLNLLEGDNKTSTKRNQIILNVVSGLLEARFNALAADPSAVSALQQSLLRGDIGFYTNNNVLIKYFSAVLPQTTVQDTMQLGMNYDQKSVNFSKPPALTLSGKITIKSDLSTGKELTLTAEGPENMQNLFLCTPKGSSSFTTGNVKADLFSQVVDSDLGRTCSYFLPDTDYKYQLDFKTNPFDKSPVSGYNYKIEFAASPGITVNYDLEFIFEGGTNIVAPDDTGYSIQDNGYLYRGILTPGQVFSFTYK